jgi:cytochrome P450
MDPAIQESPFEYYHALHEQAPVYLMPDTGAYLVSRYRDVQHVIGHPEIWSNDLLGKAGFSMFQHEEARDVLESKGWPRDTKLQTDPPEHRHYRALVATAFTAGRVKALAPFIRSIAEALVDEMAESHECEFVQDFAAWLPIRVLTELLGLPPQDAPQIKHWSDAWVEPLGGDITKQREIEVAELGVELQRYLADWMEKKRAEPGEDLLTDLAHARFPDGQPLPMGEKMGLAEHLLVGGHETVTSALASSLMLLIQHPDVESQLRLEPALIPRFVEESLRLESPSQGFFRYALEESEVGGVRIPKGAMVQVRFAAANRDPEQFPDPDVIDLHRPNAGSHMAFSQGEHHCIGAPLARLELQTAIRAILERFEAFELSPGERLEHLPGLALRTLRSLRVRYRKRATPTDES